MLTEAVVGQILMLVSQVCPGHSDQDIKVPGAGHDRA